MDPQENFLTCMTMNLKGQATLDFSKQKAIEDVIRRGNYDVVMMQEIDLFCRKSIFI